MSEQPDFTLPREIEGALKAIFSHTKPDPTFVERLGRQLSDQAGQFTTQWRKIQVVVSPLVWGAIAIIFIVFLVWGIKTLIPRVEPSRSTQPTPSPIISPTVPVEPTQAEGAETVINLPVPAGMPVPWPAEAITSMNAAQITQLARWGRETISTVAWAPDGKSFAVASSTKIYIYDSVTFQEIHTIEIGSSVYQIAISPDGTKLASPFNESSVVIWDVASGSALLTLEGHKNFISGVAFSPDGTILASGASEEPIKLWDAASGQELRTLGESAGYAFVFSPDGSIIATVIGEKTIKLWDIASGEALRTIAGHTDYISGMTFSLDGTRLASWSWSYEPNEKIIKLWDVATGNEQRTLTGQGSYLNNVAFLPDGNTLVSIAEGEPITVWDIASGQVLRTFGDVTQGNNFVLSPNGQMALYYGYQGDAIRLLDIANGKELGKLDWQTYIVTSIDISPTGKIVALGLDSGGIRLLDAVNGQLLRTLAGHTKEVDHLKAVSNLAFSPDGTLLASAGMDETTRLWDVTSGEEIYRMEGSRGMGVYVGGNPSVDFSPDGMLLAYAGTSGQVKLWDVTTHQELRTLGGQAGSPYADEVMGVAFSPDGKILASGYVSGSITLWDPLTGQVLATLIHSSNQWNNNVTTLEFSPDGKTLASGYVDGYFTLWDVVSGSELSTVSFTWDNGIARLVFSPNGDVLAIGGFGTIVLLDVASGKELITLESGANGLAFLPDGKQLISGSYDGAIRLWGIPPANATQREDLTKLPSEEVSPVQEPTPEATPEELNIEKIPIPILLTGEGLQAWWWSPDGSYFPYSQQGPIGEPGPDQATTTLYFLEARTGEICPSIQETVTFTQTEWSPSPVRSGMFDRTIWMDDNHLLYFSPDGELLSITPCSDSIDNWSASLPDKITSFSYGSIDDSQILLKGEQAYWLFTPSTRQSVKLDLPVPEEGKEIGFARSPWEPKLISSRLEDRQGELWIVLESIDMETGSTTPITEIQASPEIQYSIPMSVGIEWTSKDQILVYDTITGMRLYNISSQPLQFTNLFPDLFGIEYPGMGQVSAWGTIRGTGERDFHMILETGMAADGLYYIYHPESGVVDQYPLYPSLLVVFPNGEGGIAKSFMESSPSNNTYKVILVDSGTEPYDLVANGHTPGQNSWSFATFLPGAQKVMFSSIQGISLVDINSGDILNFWGLENQVEYQDFNATLSPDGKTVVGFASSKEPGQGYVNQAMYWLRLEP